jgi:hypothetical protein
MRNIILVLGILVAGCASSTVSPVPQAQPPVSQETEPAATVGAPSPSPTIDVTALAKQYLALATASNKAQAKVAASCKGNLTLKQLHTCYAKSAAAIRTFYEAKNRLQFRPEMAGDAKAVIRTASVLYVLWREAATAPSIAVIDSLQPRIDRAGTALSAASNTLRLDLGLPPVPIK